MRQPVLGMDAIKHVGIKHASLQDKMTSEYMVGLQVLGPIIRPHILAGIPIFNTNPKISRNGIPSIYEYRRIIFQSIGP